MHLHLVGFKITYKTAGWLTKTPIFLARQRGDVNTYPIDNVMYDETCLQEVPFAVIGTNFSVASFYLFLYLFVVYLPSSCCFFDLCVNTLAQSFSPL